MLMSWLVMKVPPQQTRDVTAMPFGPSASRESHQQGSGQDGWGARLRESQNRVRSKCCGRNRRCKSGQLREDADYHGRARQRRCVCNQAAIRTRVATRPRIGTVMVRGSSGVGEIRSYGRGTRVVRVVCMVRVKGVMRAFGRRAAQRLGYRRRDHAQQDREDPEDNPDLLTATAGHGRPTRRRYKQYAENLRRDG
nr:hypothetical protein [Burkholderia ubonensis]